MEKKITQVIRKIITKIEIQTATKMNVQSVKNEFEITNILKNETIYIRHENKIFYVYNDKNCLRSSITCVTTKMVYQTILNAVFLMDKNTIESKKQWDVIEKHRKQTIELDKKKYLQEVENSRDGVLQILKKYAEFVRAIGKQKDFQIFLESNKIT